MNKRIKKKIAKKKAYIYLDNWFASLPSVIFVTKNAVNKLAIVTENLKNSANASMFKTEAQNDSDR